MWEGLENEWALWGRAGLKPRFWLRDDDCTEPTPALNRLAALAARFRAPVLLAVIPMGADASLGEAVARQPLLQPCQHGFAHANHASKHEKPQELGPHRAMGEILAELAAGQGRLRDLFGAALRPVLVPPWNRIDPLLGPHLFCLGFSAVSAFGPPARPVGRPLRIDSQIDLIDWRNGRGGISTATLIVLLQQAMSRARQAGGAPVGVLSHHLAHDEPAWRVLEELLRRTTMQDPECWIGYEALADMAAAHV